MKKQKLESQISVNPTPHDLTVIHEIALAERRKPTEVIRNLFEDALDGKVTLDVAKVSPGKRHAMGVMVEPTFKSRFDQFKEEKHLSADKILHLALQNFSQKAIAGEVTSDDITEHLIRQQVEEDRAQAKTSYTEAERALAIQHLMDKHRHSNSPRPSTLKDAA